jgi:hypothetical protein
LKQEPLKIFEGSSYLIEVALEFLWYSLWLLCCKLLFLIFLFQLVATLPEHVQPGPDFYGLPWKPVILTIFLGMASFYLFFWRVFVFVSKLTYNLTHKYMEYFIITGPFICSSFSY